MFSEEMMMMIMTMMMMMMMMTMMMMMMMRVCVQSWRNTASPVLRRLTVVRVSVWP